MGHQPCESWSPGDSHTVLHLGPKGRALRAESWNTDHRLTPITAQHISQLLSHPVLSVISLSLSFFVPRLNIVLFA